MHKKLIFHKLKSIILKVSSLLILTYLLNNSSCSFSSTEIETLKNYEDIKTFFSNYCHSEDSSLSDIPKWRDSIVFINTSYDNELVPVLEGNDAITRRKDIYDFLKILYEKNIEYKYIIIDISLDSIKNVYNDSLASLIPKMKNVVVGKGQQQQYGLLKPLELKAGSVDYHRGVFSPEFIRFDYGVDSDSLMTLPLYAYNEMTGRTINGYFFNLLYFDNRSLCQSSNVILFDILIKNSQIFSSGNTDYTKLMYHNINVFKEKNNIKERRIEWYKSDISNKIIVISNLFGTDKHMTYLGDVPGSIILVNALNHLSQHKHIINWLHVLFLFVFYCSIYIIIFYKGSILNNLKERFELFNSEIISLLLSFVGWATFFHFVSLLLYTCFNIFYNAWYPIMWFTFIPICSDIYNTIKKK